MLCRPLVLKHFSSLLRHPGETILAVLTIRERALTVFAGGRERQGEASPQLYFIALSAKALSSSLLGCRTQSQTPEKWTGPVIPFPRLNISLPVMLDLQVLLQRPSGRV